MLLAVSRMIFCGFFFNFLSTDRDGEFNIGGGCRGGGRGNGVGGRSSVDNSGRNGVDGSEKSSVNGFGGGIAR